MSLVNDTIIRQYSNSPKLISIIEKFNAAIGTEKYINDIYDLVWDIDTCNSVGLEIWGKIVVVSRFLEVDNNENYFGFSEADNLPSSDVYPQPFGFGVFYDGGGTTKVYRLSDDAYRRLIKYKALYNISNTTIPSINKFLMSIFAGKGRVYAIDNRDMTINIMFEFSPDPVDLSIIKYANVLPRPSGVKFNFFYVTSPYFGFANDAFPFNDGTFYKG